MKTFSTCIADPPWPYGNGGKGGRVLKNGRVTKRGGGFAGDHYGVMSIPELYALGPLIKPLGIDYLFLWVAKKFLFHTQEGFEVMRQWGFIPKSCLVWHKNKGSGVGSWFKSDIEFVLLGVSKSAHFLPTCETDYFGTGRLGHSIKPDYIHELAERKFPGPYLELFGRRTYNKNWTVLGNEVGDKKDIRESLAELSK